MISAKWNPVCINQQQVVLSVIESNSSAISAQD